MSTNNLNTNCEIGDDLTITKKTRRLSAGGTWVRGSLNGHRFECLDFSRTCRKRKLRIGR